MNTEDNNAKRTDFMLTTKDNPYSPFTQHDFWQSYDHQKGYYSEEYLARVAPTSFDLSDEENEMIINQAIEDIIRLDEHLGVGYTKAYPPKDYES